MSEPNPNWVEAPYMVDFLFAMSSFNWVHPRKRRLKFRRRAQRVIRKMLERKVNDMVAATNKAEEVLRELVIPCNHAWIRTPIQRYGELSTTGIVCPRCGTFRY